MTGNGESKQGDPLDQAILNLYEQDLSRDISRDALIRLLTSGGIGSPLAAEVADDALAYLKDQPAGFALNDVRIALTAAIGSLATIVPSIWWNRLLEIHPELREPPKEEDPIVVPGVGTVHRGETTVTTGDLERPYIWIWLERLQTAPCEEYRWYQFVKPELYVNSENENADDRFKAATGLYVTMGKWNPDYHKRESREEDAERRRRGQPKLPKFKPSLPPDQPGGRPPPVKPGKPFVETDVPGSRRTEGDDTSPHAPGVLDSPNFNERPEPDEPSTIEQLWFDNTPSRGQGDNPPTPAEGIDEVEVRVHVRTYLVCIDDGEATCIGCLSWTAHNRARIHWGWEEDPDSVPTMDLNPPKHWKRNVRRTEFSMEIEFGEWGPC